LISNVSSLSHKSFYHPVEYIILVMQSFSLFSCTDCSEIFSSFWNLFTKYLKNYSSFFNICTFISNLDIKICLSIFWIKWRQFFMNISNFNAFFFLIYSFLEKFFHCLLLRACKFFLFLFQKFKFISQFFISWIQFNCSF
jgi:hypothetical protein